MDWASLAAIWNPAQGVRVARKVGQWIEQRQKMIRPDEGWAVEAPMGKDGRWLGPEGPKPSGEAR